MIKVNRATQPLVYISMLLILILTPLSLFLNNYHLANQKGNYLVYDYAKNILDTMPPKSILITTGDTLIGGLSYLLAVEGQKPDLILVKEMIGYPWYIEHLAKQYPKLKLPFFSGTKSVYNMSDLVAANLKDYSIFIGNSFDRSLAQNYNLIPWGLLKMVRPKDQSLKLNSYKQLQNQIWQRYRIDYERLTKLNNFDFEKTLAYSYTSTYNQTGNFWLKYNDYAEAIKYWEKAISLSPQYPAPYKMLGWAYIKSAKNYAMILKGLHYWKIYLDFNPDDPEVPQIKKDLERIKRDLEGRRK